MRKRWLVLVLCLSSLHLLYAADLYVWTNSPNPAPPYNTWTNAARDIQTAVTAATDRDTVWVTNGVYRTGGWAAHGAMTSRVAILYAVTVRSVNGAEHTVIEGQGPIGDTAIRGVYLHSNATLIGFTISNGHTRSSGGWFYEQSGGGIACYNKTAVISNCIVRNCMANDSGGGIADGTVYGSDIIANSAGTEGAGVFAVYLFDSLVEGNSCDNLGGGSSSSLLVDSRLIGNTASSGGGGAYSGILSNCLVEANEGITGGGIRSATASRCHIADNRARDGAGAVQSTLFHCTLMNNTAQEWGGGAYQCGGDWYGPNFNRRMENCFVSGNQAEQGGGVYESTLLNCTVVDNTAQEGGGAFKGIATNSIVYYNRAFIGSSNHTESIFDYSCTVPLPEGGVGNITVPPGLNGLGNPHLLTNAPCIDAGWSAAAVGATDIDGESRVDGSAVDIGCDELIRSGMTGELAVAMYVQSSIASTAYPLQAAAVVSGKVTFLQWDWGDGQTTDNEWSPSHLYAETGTCWVSVTAWNDTTMASASTSVKVVEYAATYVSPTGGHAYPYTAWANAATTIQDAVDAAPVGGQVWVEAGEYAAVVRDYNGMAHRLVVDKPLTVSAVSPGYFQTIIRGAGPAGPGAVRCVYLTTGSRLEGFTLADGATRTNTGFFATWEACGGGGAICENGAVMSNCWIVGNRAVRCGGGVVGGTLRNSVLLGNWAARDGGGAQSSELIGCLAISNYAVVSGGALMQGIACDSIFYTNRCGSDGGGMSESRASNCLLAVNDARWGGGASRGSLTACVVSNNTAEFGGGMSGGKASNCWFVGNVAQDRGSMFNSGEGGGVYGVSNWNSVMIRNRADTYGGGGYVGIYHHCTVVNNQAGEGYGGGGIYRGAVYNSIIYYNFCTNAWYDSTNVWGPDEIKFSCSSQTNILSGDYYTNNIIDPPQFVNLPSLDLRLAASSPCIDTGDPGDPEGSDFNGVARPLDGDADGTVVADMGAYEYASPLADTDGDDMNDAGEVLAGTNPRDDHSYLQVGSVGRDGVPAGSLWVKWGSVEGRSYDLAMSTNLMSDDFGLVVLTNVAATPPLNVVTTAPGVDFTNAFYRIQLGE